MGSNKRRKRRPTNRELAEAALVIGLTTLLVNLLQLIVSLIK